MQDLPALYLGLIPCCHPWLFFTNSTCQIPGKSLRLLFLTMSFVTASSGFCLWLFGILLPDVCVSSLPVGLSVLKTVLWASPAIVWASSLWTGIQGLEDCPVTVNLTSVNEFCCCCHTKHNLATLFYLPDLTKSLLPAGIFTLPHGLFTCWIIDFPAFPKPHRHPGHYCYSPACCLQ